MGAVLVAVDIKWRCCNGNSRISHDWTLQSLCFIKNRFIRIAAVIQQNFGLYHGLSS